MDRHVHTPFCPHGTKDTLESYIEQALEKKLEGISFTEHMPLPEGIIEEAFAKVCSPSASVMLEYFKEVEKVKKKYEHQIMIKAGLEVDYLEGRENETKQLLNLYGPYMEDGLLSVHFLKVGHKHYCFDSDLEAFEELVQKVGSLEQVYRLYYETLYKAIEADLGKYKPRRIGHPTLIRIFNKAYPFNGDLRDILEKIMRKMKEKNYSIEINTGGLRKSLCRELYPEPFFLEQARWHGIPIYKGSDAHCAKDVGYGFEKL